MRSSQIQDMVYPPHEWNSNRFSPNIIPMTVECQLQDVNCYNTLLCAGEALLLALQRYLLIYRFWISSRILTIITWYSQYFCNPSLHYSFWSGRHNQPTFVVAYYSHCSFHFTVLQLGLYIYNLKYLITADITIGFLFLRFLVLRLGLSWYL